MSMTTQQVEKKRIPWTHPKLSTDDTFIDRILRPLLRVQSRETVQDIDNRSVFLGVEANIAVHSPAFMNGG